MMFGLIVLLSVFAVGVIVSWLYSPGDETGEDGDGGVRRVHRVHVDAFAGGAWVVPGAVDGFPDEEYEQHVCECGACSGQVEDPDTAEQGDRPDGAGDGAAEGGEDAEFGDPESAVEVEQGTVTGDGSWELVGADAAGAVCS